MRRAISLLLAAALVVSFAVAPATARERGPTIVEAAIAVNAATGEFDHLIAAVVRADLVGTLSGRRQFTVFAPTDAAFEDLFNALGVDGIEEIPVGTLTAVLLHHVSPGERFSDDVLGSSRVRMIDRSFTFPSIQDGVPFIDNAAIVLPDVDVSNGVIHVIDAVLIP
jgi:transforming growth factor-beta-induced protein